MISLETSDRKAAQCRLTCYRFLSVHHSANANVLDAIAGDIARGQTVEEIISL